MNCNKTFFTPVDAKEKLQQLSKTIHSVRCGKELQLAIQMAIKSLEKEIPIEPKEIDDNFGYFECANCSRLIYYSDLKESHEYCLNCGQKIDWD